jgi:hypothetical protein
VWCCMCSRCRPPVSGAATRMVRDSPAKTDAAARQRSAASQFRVG